MLNFKSFNSFMSFEFAIFFLFLRGTVSFGSLVFKFDFLYVTVG